MPDRYRRGDRIHRKRWRVALRAPQPRNRFPINLEKIIGLLGQFPLANPNRRSTFLIILFPAQAKGENKYNNEIRLKKSSV